VEFQEGSASFNWRRHATCFVQKAGFEPRTLRYVEFMYIKSTLCILCWLCWLCILSCLFAHLVRPPGPPKRSPAALTKMARCQPKLVLAVGTVWLARTCVRMIKWKILLKSTDIPLQLFNHFFIGWIQMQRVDHRINQNKNSIIDYQINLFYKSSVRFLKCT